MVSLCLFTNSGVQHILFCAFVFFTSSCVLYVASFSGLFFFVLCTLCCQFLWIVFLRLVYSMLPVSLDCPFLIATSVFSNVYLLSYNVLTRIFTFTNVTSININFKAMFTVHGTHIFWTNWNDRTCRCVGVIFTCKDKYFSLTFKFKYPIFKNSNCRKAIFSRNIKPF